MLTKTEFDNFLSKCKVDFIAVIGHISEKKGVLNDEDGNPIASIDYIYGITNVEKEIYISDTRSFNPSIIQEARILETIDTLTFNDREQYEYDLKNEKINQLT